MAVPFITLTRQYETLKDYYNGKRPVPAKRANVILSKMDKSRFAGYIDGLSHDALDALCKDLKDYGIVSEMINVGDVCASLFEQALQNIANKKKPNKIGNEEFAKEIGIVPDGYVPMETVYVKDGRLHIGNSVIELSDKLSPPENISDEENGYVPKLYEAYSSAEPSEVTHEIISKYPQYSANLKQQRTNYFNAVYVVNIVRSKFGKEWGAQLDYLKQETYDGISDVYYGDHAHGYARLNAVMTQAVNSPIKKSLLADIRNLVGNSEKKGVCHILVSEGTIKSWVDIYDA